MTSLRKPRYLKIFDIQSMLKYIFLKEKRPAFIQLKKMPKVVFIVQIDEERVSPPSDGRTKARIYSCGETRSGSLNKEAISTVNGSNLEAVFRDIGINTTVHINEHMELGFIIQNMLRSIEIFAVDIGCITSESLSLVERHDILHLFSYSTFIKSQTDFNEENFKSFVRPKRRTEYFLVAIDCEMVLGITGPKLGRVTILDHQGRIVYDKYVKPGEDVLDYREQYSGLNVENLSLGITFRQLQDEILEIIGINTCVLGHGLENDLEVLQLYVDDIIDTAYLFLSSEGYKIKLNQLSKKYLNEIIQQQTHCSHEDALCCLKLLAYKIQQIQRLCDDNTPFIDLGTTVLRQPHIRNAESVAKRQLKEIEDAGSQMPILLLFTHSKIGELRENLPVEEDFFALIFYEKDAEVYMAFRQK